MSPYESNTTLARIAADLKAVRRIAVTTHAKPDGDAWGSVVALTRALQNLGKLVEPWFMPPVLQSLRRLEHHLPVHVVDKASMPGEFDRIVVVDTGAWAQLEPLKGWLSARRDRVIVVDHHLRGDDVGAALYVDAKAAASAEIVAELIDALGAPLDRAIAEALFVGIASDTGWFRFSNARPQTHRLAARLLEFGVDHADLHMRLEQAERPEKLGLMIRALDSLKLVAGGKAAVMTLLKKDFTETGARYEETERLVDLPQVVQSVHVAALITETAEGTLRVSFRSKPDEEPIDVNELARQFGGGGHARAAAAKTQLKLPDGRDRIIAAIEKAFGK